MQAQESRTLILGLGISGLSMARWLARQACALRVADTRAAPPNLAALQAEVPDAQFVSGAFSPDWLDGVSRVFISPGLSPQACAGLLALAAERGVPVMGELALFAQALRDLAEQQNYQPKVLAITGTNGKTTVTSLTGHLLARAGHAVAVAGNIGPALLDTLTQHLQAGTLPEVWVLELSSFQLHAYSELEGAAAFNPTAATVLNLTQDHLDWHGDMAAYAADKARVFGAQGVMVLNRQDPWVAAMRPPAAAKPAKGLKPEPVRRVLTFGADMPTAPGDFGLEMLNGMAWLVRAHEADETRKRRQDAAEPELFIQRLMPADALRIRGRHNALNALAALALASSVNQPLAPLLYGLREYRGEPHRVESVGLVGDVEYFDDSKGTNVGATVAALDGLGADRKLLVILGGDGKGQDFAPLAAPVARHARAVVLIGRDAPLIRQALAETGVPMLDAVDMAEAVALAADRAHAGDAVLLSPACASLDMFKDYADRAAHFRAAVRQLAEAAGVFLEGAP